MDLAGLLAGMVWQGLLQSADHRGADHQPDDCAAPPRVLSAIIGTLAALGLERMSGWIRNVFDALIYIAILVPGIVIGISTLIAFVSFFDMVNPYLHERLEHPHRNGRLDRDRRPRAVQHRGRRASRARTACRAWTAAWWKPRKIFTPHPWEPSAKSCCHCWRLPSWRASCWPSLFRSRISSSRSFVAGPSVTLPIYVFSSIRRGVTPEINAVGTVVLLTSLILLIVAQLILQRGSRTTAR